MSDWIYYGFIYGMPLTLIALGFLAGTLIESAHYADIRRREAELRGFPVITFEALPPGWNPIRAGLVTGSVVVSVDYFKRFVAGLRGIVGGRIKGYEPLLDRARREALLRMIEEARAGGFDAVINARLETSRLANADGQRSSTAGVEILAFGTAIERSRR